MGDERWNTRGPGELRPFPFVTNGSLFSTVIFLYRHCSAAGLIYVRCKKARKTKRDREAPNQFIVALNSSNSSFANEPRILVKSVPVRSYDMRGHSETCDHCAAESCEIACSSLCTSTILRNAAELCVSGIAFRLRPRSRRFQMGIRMGSRISLTH